jgi:hypothetical protein
MAVRNVISTLTQDGTEVMGPGVLMYLIGERRRYLEIQA